MEKIFKKRIVAYIADYFVVSAVMWIIAQILAIIIVPYSMFIVYDYFIFLAPVVGILYFVILEKNKKTTVGKHLMFLEVVSTINNKNSYSSNYSNNSISYKQAIIRNLSKIYWVPIIFDLIIGKLYGQSNERILGRLSRTMVIEEDLNKY
ncbi:MAG: RDD family protein [Methanobrevibacter sp.]|jgi:uncharacterized RDD family membrane protein YckC|nr:RDD family protein [Methanobrevibacter sp.]